jgi:hypothetical protein
MNIDRKINKREEKKSVTKKSPERRMSRKRSSGLKKLQTSP